jgi:hypothetical protein
MKRTTAAHEFIEFIPPLQAMEEGKVYVSIPYATVAHRCMCGCGSEVVTPLSPIHWQLTFDGKTISLHPSIGSWRLPCQSHYWIRNDKVIWARRWSREEIERGRAGDRLATKEYFEGGATSKRAKKPRGVKHEGDAGGQ